MHMSRQGVPGVPVFVHSIACHALHMWLGIIFMPSYLNVVLF